MPRKTPTRSSRTEELFESRLEASGLTVADAKELGLTILDPEETGALGWADPRPAMKINYYGVDNQPASDLPGASPFFRIRYLDQPQGFSTQQESAKKELRYKQPDGSFPMVYFPRIIDWLELMPDVSQPLIITEGEMKACSGAILGFPVIGLGGVWNWRSSKMGIDLLGSLAQFEWVRRTVYIVFDSDLGTNTNVLAAVEALAKELGRRGALVYLAWIPEVLGPGIKVGLDDYLLFYAGEEASQRFDALLATADLIGISQPLFDLNDRYVYVADPGLLVDTRTDAKHKPSALKEHLAAPTTVNVRKLTTDGDLRYEKVSAGPEWLKWPLRRSVDKITYLPGQDRFTIASGRSCYNTWTGWGCTPAAGDATPFLTLVHHLFRGAGQGAEAWFLRWLAYPLQYPGTKLFTSAVVYGIRHGTGKSLIGYSMSRIYGDNFTAIKQADLHGSFNEWAQGKQFVLGDDVTGSDKRQDSDILKTLITQEKVRINPKYVPSYEVPDCINYLFTSNQPDSFFMEDNDRRYFVHEVTVQPLSEEFYMEFGIWLDSGGPAALFDYLLNLDLGGFNPAAPAMETAAKGRMIADVRSDLASWCRRLLEDPDSVLRLGDIPVKRAMFTNKELLGFYDPTGHTKTSSNGLGRELRRAGVIMVNEGQSFKTANGVDRYYAVRDVERWRTATRTELAKYLDGELDHVTRRPKY